MVLWRVELWSATRRSFVLSLLFCCGINGLVNEIQKLNPVYNKWYMDDGGIIGDVETLQQAWKIIQERGPEMGLHHSTLPSASGLGSTPSARTFARSSSRVWRPKIRSS